MKRTISLLLTLLMVFSLFSGLSFSAQAKGGDDDAWYIERLQSLAERSQILKTAPSVYVSDLNTLVEYLEDTGSYNIVLTADCCDSVRTLIPFYCLVKGTKSLDLNGHTVYLSTVDQKEATLFRVDNDAYLELCDNSGGSGRINYDGYINKNGPAQIRNLFDVYGTMICNGGWLDPGREKRTKRVYTDSEFALLGSYKVSAQVIGSAVIVRPNGNFIMNDGIIYGRGLTRSALWVLGDANSSGLVIVNGGKIRGEARADGLKAPYPYGGKIKLMSGQIETHANTKFETDGPDYYCNIYDQSECDHYKPNSQGGISFASAQFRTTGYKGYDYQSWPQNCRLIFDNDEDEYVEQLATQAVTRSQATITIGKHVRWWPDIEGFYFQGLYGPFLNHINELRYDWEVLAGNRWISGRINDSDTINVFEEWEGFTPQPGQEYHACCTVTEKINGREHITVYEDIPFVIPNGTAPTILSEAGDVTFRNGDTIQLRVDASSETPLTYQWESATPYAPDDWGRYVYDEDNGTNTVLSLSDLHQGCDGWRFRCRVSNDFKEVITEPYTLRYDTGSVNNIQLSSPQFAATSTAYQPTGGKKLETNIQCLTPGVELVSAKWTAVSPSGDGSTATLKSTFTGQQPVLSVRVRFNPGVEPNWNGVRVSLDGIGYDTSGNNNSLDFWREGETLYGDYVWYFNTLSGGRTSAIDTVSVRTRGSVAPGMLLSDTIESSMGYSVPRDLDARYEVGNTYWSCDGAPAEVGDMMLGGANYTVSTELIARDGWQFTPASVVMMDGERCAVVYLDSTKILATRTHYVTEEDDPDFKNWNVVVGNQAKPSTDNANDVLDDGGTVTYWWEELDEVIDYLGLIGPTVKAGYQVGEVLQDDVGWHDSYSNDFRYDIASCEWSSDGQPMPYDKYNYEFKYGEPYELSVRLTPNYGYKFVSDCDVYLNGQYVPGKLQSDGSLLIETSWNIGDSGGLVPTGSNAPKKSKKLAPVGEDEESTVDVGTLKLNGDYEADKTFVVNDESGLTIYLEKDVTIHTTGGKSAFILNADTTITGPGSLTVIVDDSGTSANGPAAIEVNGCKLTLDNVRVKLQGCNGIRGKNKAKLDVNYSTVDIEVQKGALFDFYGKMTLTDTGIKEPTDYLVGSTAGFYDRTSAHNPVGRVYLSPERSVQSLTIEQGDSISIKGGQSKKLSVVITPSDAAKQEVTWTASNSNVKVSPDGVVTACKVGNARVTASCGGKTASIGITITSNAVDVQSIDLIPHEITIGVGQTAAIRGSVTPGYASDLSGFWYTDNTSVATVANSGTISDLTAEPMLVTGVAPGDADIVMFSYGYADGVSCTVHVVENYVAAQSVSISGSATRTMHSGDTATLSATVTPANATDKTVLWTSSAPDIVSVNQNGRITAEGIGDAIVTAEIWNGSEFVQSSVEIHVPYPVYGVGVSSPKSRIYVGGSVQLEAGVYPGTAENKAVAWESSNPSVATVDENGLVKGVADGSATITVTTAEGGYTDSVTVSVEALPIHVTELTADRNEITMPIGSTRRVYVTVSPDDADNRAWTWESTDESVARVSNCADGEYVFTEYAEIYSDGDGKATVTIRSEDGNRMARIRVTSLPAGDYVAVERVELPPEIVIGLGSCVSVLPKVYPENASEKTFRVSVDVNDDTVHAESGVIFGDQLGTANITVKVGEQSAVSTVRVVESASSMTISDKTAELAFGQTKQLSATVAPSNAYDKAVTWSSSDMSVVTVNDSGKLTAVGYGEATITATNDFSGLSKTCTVIVPDPTYELYINGEQVSESNLSDLPAGVTYAPAIKTLTLSGSLTSNADAALIRSSIDGLTVKVTGNATLSSRRSAFVFEANATVTGGKLTVSAPTAAAIVVRNGAALTLKDTDLTLNGATGILGGNTGESLTADNAVVAAGSMSCGVSGFDSIVLTGCSVSAPKNAVVKDGAIVVGDTPAASVTISNIVAVKLGDTDGDGDVTIIDATYIQRDLAGLDNKTGFVEAAADTDADGDLTIVDATFIQRWLAGLPSNENIGKPI